MTTEELLKTLKTSQTLLVHNDPLDYQGRAEVTLDGGVKVYWLFGEDGAFISVNPETDEMMDFWKAEEDIEREEDVVGVGYRGENYELSYEDKGSVTKVEGDVPVEEGEVFIFQDYENESGALVRTVQNETTGDEQSYTGSVLAEEEVTLVED
ncbi:hypothetical protein HY734_00130 [Candidatus Uhrbacteria bacterium]|nr:hypothetical protein [Candidatus Uhrbacteria bacterium]